MIAIGGMLLGVTFLEATAACAYLPDLTFVAEPVHTTALSTSAKMLLPAAVVLLIAMVLLRLFVPVDLFYLYSSVIEKHDVEFGKGTSRGAVFCIVGFGLGMLALDG